MADTKHNGTKIKTASSDKLFELLGLLTNEESA